MSNYYAADFDPWVSSIRNIGSMLTQMPAMKARIAAQQQLANYRQAEISEAAAREEQMGANTRKLNAEADDQEGQTASGNRLSDALKKVMANPNDTGATGDAISEFGHYFKKNPEEAAKGMGQLASQFLALRGNTNFAQQGSLQGNAAAIANNQANNTRIMNTPMVVPDNSVAIDKTTGQPVATSPQRLSMGQRLFAAGPDGVTLNTSPEVQGAPAPPHSSGVDTARNQAIREILLKESDPLKQQALIRRYDKQTGYQPPADASSTASPASSVPISAAVSAAQPPTPPPAATNAPAGDMVRVMHPNGQTGFIPSANLPAALQLGYKQIAQ
jgi:hypothetical protein